MKPVMDKEQYDSNLSPIAHNMVPLVFIIGLGAVIIYQLIRLIVSKDLDGLQFTEIIVDTGFKAIVVWAAVYFVKKNRLVRTTDSAYENADDSGDKYFIPLVRETSIINSKFGVMYLTKDEILFVKNSLGVDKDVIQFPMENAIFDTEEQASNFLAKAFWTETTVLTITNKGTNKVYKFLVPNAPEVKDALIQTQKLLSL